MRLFKIVLLVSAVSLLTIGFFMKSNFTAILLSAIFSLLIVVISSAVNNKEKSLLKKEKVRIAYLKEHNLDEYKKMLYPLKVKYPDFNEEELEHVLLNSMSK